MRRDRWGAAGGRGDAGAKGLNVRYHYCVVIADISPQDDRNNNCSSDATAIFNVTAPSVAVKPSGAEFFVSQEQSEMVWGLRFPASETSPATVSGSYSWIQLIQSYDEEGYLNIGTTISCKGGPGFDSGKGEFPYATGLSGAEDGPVEPLDSSIQSRQVDNDTFRMYLMWSGDSDPTAVPQTESQFIPVPLGYVEWTLSGDAIWDTGDGTWIRNSSSLIFANGGSTTFEAFSPSNVEPQWGTGINAKSTADSCQ